MDFLKRLFSEDFKHPELFIVISGAILFLPFLGYTHLFDWDEINFAESAREMLLTGNYFRVMIDYVPFWEKPPLFFWLQSLSMHLFGVNEFAARFPNAVCGVITLVILYRLGKKLKDHTFGMLWVFLYLGALLPHLYFKSGIIDPVFNLFIFLGIWYLIETINANQLKSALTSGVFTGLAILTKGPVGLLLVLLTFLVYWSTLKFRKVSSFKHILVFALSVFVVSSLWFGAETIKNGPWFIVEFIQYQIRLFSTPDAGHEQPFYYHFAVVLIGCFPMSVLAIPNLFNTKNDSMVPFNTAKWMRILFWVVMILFTIVRTKIVHYSSMAYLPLSFLAALFIYQYLNDGRRLPSWLLIINLAIGLVLGLLLIALPVLLIRKDWLLQLISHPSLQVEVPMYGWEYLGGVIYILFVIWFFIRMRRGQLKLALFSNAFVLGLILLFNGYFVVPKVEAYSQRPAIDFYQTLEGKDIYVLPMFRTYAHYFYAKVQPENSTHLHEREWFLSGAIDKPVYFSTFVSREGDFAAFDDIEFLYSKGDFAFYRRMPVSN